MLHFAYIELCSREALVEGTLTQVCSSCTTRERTPPRGALQEVLSEGAHFATCMTANTTPTDED